MQKGLSGGAPAKRKKEVYSDFTPKSDDAPVIQKVLGVKFKPFKEFAVALKKENPSKFTALTKYIQQQRNMDRIQNYIVDNFCPVTELEARKKQFFCGTVSQCCFL